MATYTEMVDMVLDWANRDKEVLSYRNIKTLMRYGTDNIYRQLRIVPLEYVTTYNISGITASSTNTNRLTVPSDAIEFIQLRQQDDNSLTDYNVYASKPDIRSFLQEQTYNGGFYTYTREGNDLIVYPDLKNGDKIELYYYRRLPDPWERWEVDSENVAAGRTDVVTDTENMTSRTVSRQDLERDPDLRPTTWGTGRRYGLLKNNWLRDDNEKLVLFGTLAEAFNYLDDMEMKQKFEARFAQEIGLLMDEEHNRQYKGGNVIVHYQAPLI